MKCSQGRCHNKKIGIVGDSFAARARNPQLYSFVSFIEPILGCTLVNYGVTGTGFQRQNQETRFSERVEYMDDDLDYIIVMGGVNDFGPRDGIAEFDLGNLDDRVGADSFYGMVRATVENLLMKYPDKKIGFITPTRIASMQLKLESGVLYGRDVNSFGHTLPEYVNAIMVVCKEYAIPCLNLYDSCGFNDLNILKFTDDGLHPNKLGCDFLASKIANFIEGL